MRLSHNLPSLNIFREYVKNTKKNSQALSRISTGEKIIKAGDDPYGLSKSERMRIQIRGMQMAQRNLQDGVSMLQTADSGLDSLNSITQRMRELTIQSGNGCSDEDKKIIKSEMDEMIEAFKTIVSNTEFNGTKLLNVDEDRLMQIGTNVGDNMDIPLVNLSPDKIGVMKKNDSGELELKTLQDLKDKDILSEDFIDSSLEILDAVSNKLVDVRSKYGAINNMFEGEYDNLSEFEIGVTEAESSIRDADVAEEIIEFAKTGLLMEAGNAMMVQSNKLPQEVLRILENVRSR
ncbi:flagellin [uncultured Clostridium sp.]|uniref:flagellin N-terminal helical domain-containing protein n=1 Tax=uncultured Clostridium sp. TaxID=59620 RepID=UPI0028E3B51F|nr:flagellin [uncultured Clostridium sp.]